MSSASIATTVPMEAGNYSAYLKPDKMRIGKSFISTDLKPTLERFILSSDNCNDRSKALEMLTYIDDCKKRFDHDNSLIQEYKLKKCFQRPCTAHAKLYSYPNLERFSTTYKEYYPAKEIKETIATRPSSTENIIIRPNNTMERADDTNDNINISNEISHDEHQKILSVYHTRTTYNNDFCSADNAEQVRHNKNKNISSNRAATSSGSRCHNPHPNQLPQKFIKRKYLLGNDRLIFHSLNLNDDRLIQLYWAFLVWRYPRESQNKASRIPSETILKADMDNKFANITDEQFDRVMRGNCRSTYQSDFVGGSYPESRVTPLYIQPPIKTGEKLKISTQRIDYNEPKTLPAELSVPHDRYKSNKTKNNSAQGIIPEAINKIYMNTSVRTTYDEDINDRAEVIHGQIVSDIQRKVDLNKLHNMQALERAMLDAKNVEDKEALGRIFQRLSEPDEYKRKSFVRKPFYKNDRPCWTSNWPGPL